VAPHEYPTPNPTNITSVPDGTRPLFIASFNAMGIEEDTVLPQ
jgi:hypothetical protein